MEKEGQPTFEDVDTMDVGSYFPFQTQTQIVSDPKKCPIQKKFTKLKVTSVQSFDDVVGSLKEKLESLSKRSTANSKLQIKQLESKLEFLEKNKSYVFEMAKPFLDHRTLTFLKKKNLDFLYYTKGLTHLKKLRGLIRYTSVYFYPNRLHTEDLETQNNGLPFTLTKKCKSTSGKQVMASLKFLFVDIDGADSWDAVKAKLEDFKLAPDVIVQTSEKSFHLYWSVQPVELETSTEEKNGDQLDRQLILYELALRSLISFFGADKHRSHASSLMRVPDTWNIKPHKNKRFLSNYLQGSRTLEQALKEPTYNFDAIVDHLERKVSPDIRKSAHEEFESRKVKPPELDNVFAPTEEQVRQQMEGARKKAEFDFTLGWKSALESFIKFFKIEISYLKKRPNYIAAYVDLQALPNA